MWFSYVKINPQFNFLGGKVKKKFGVAVLFVLLSCSLTQAGSQVITPMGSQVITPRAAASMTQRVANFFHQVEHFFGVR